MHNYLTSRRLAILLILCFFILTILRVYVFHSLFNVILAWVLAGLTVLLVTNLLLCSKKRLKYNPINMTKLPDTKYQNSLSIDRIISTDEAAGMIGDKGGKVFIEDNSGHLTIGKNGLWGSIVFHIGMAVFLVGMATNFLAGFKASTVLEEGVPNNFIEDIEVGGQGIFYREPENHLITLENYAVEFQKDTPVRFYGTMSFDNGARTQVQEVEVNKPGRYKGYYWRFAKWGYSVELEIDKGEEEVYHGWFKVMTNSNYSFNDFFQLPDESEWAMEIFPNYRQDLKGEPYSFNPQPDNMVLRLTNKEAGETGAVLLPLGATTTSQEYQVRFVNYRFWQLYDVSLDPGEWFIYAGSLLVILGLAWRTIFITKHIWFKLEYNQDITTIYWTSRATYFNSLYNEEVSRRVAKMGEKKL